MAWLKLTTANGQTTLVNSGHIVEACENRSGSGAKIWAQGSLLGVRESAEEIAAMIEQAEWRDRVLKVACAIMSNELTAGLTSEQLWARAVRFAAMDPERPQGGGDK